MANQQPLSPEEMKTINKALEERITEANKDNTKVQWKNVLPDLMAADVFAVAALGDKTDANGNRLLNIQREDIAVLADISVIILFIKRERHVLQCSVMTLSGRGAFRSLRLLYFRRSSLYLLRSLGLRRPDLRHAVILQDTAVITIAADTDSHVLTTFLLRCPILREVPPGSVCTLYIGSLPPKL